MNFNLSGFKKLHSDKKCTTLAHPDGHKIVIAHSALSPKMREKLALLPVHKEEGGFVDSMADRKKANSAVSDYGANPSDPSLVKAGKPFAEGGAVAAKGKTLGEVIGYPGSSPKAKDEQEQEQTFADGGDVAEVTPNDSSQVMQQQPNPNAQAPAATAPVVVNVGTQQPTQQPPAPAAAAQDPGVAYHVGQFVRNYVADQINGAKAMAMPIVNGAQDVIAGLANNPAGASNAPPAPAQPTPQAPSAQPSVPPQAGAQMPKPGAPADPFGTDAYLGAYMKGLNEQKAGLAGEAAASGQVGEAQAKMLNQQVEQQRRAAQVYQDHYNGLEAERSAFQRDVQNKHIDSKHYLNSMGAGSKIATGIGLILGGIGAGLTRTSNPVLDFLNQQIDRDIAAQKDNLGKSENLLNANLRQFGNLRDATDMTRVMQSDIISNQLKEAAAKAQSPMAKARALQAAGALDQAAAPVLSQMAMRKTLLSGMNSGQLSPEHVIRMIVPQGEQSAAYKELQEAQKLVSARDNVLSAFDKLNQINTIGNRAMSPIQSKRQIEAIKASVIPSLSKETAGRYTEQDAETIGKLFDTLATDSKTTAVQRAQLVKLLSEKMHFPMLKAYGIDMGRTGRFGGQGQTRIQESAPVIPSR
jgi:hypothetical protein